MPKTALTAAFAVLMAATAPLAYAQTPSDSSSTAPTTAPAPRTPSSAASTTNADRAPITKSADAFKTQSGDLRAAEMIGSTVYDVHNRNIGSVKDMVVDKEGKISAVIVDVGAFLGIGGKYVAVQLADLKTDNNRLTLNRTKEQLEAAQPYQLEPKG
jgi:hypothetical protein